MNREPWAHNDFGQLAENPQAHGGAVGGGTPAVGYAYASGSDNHVRPTQMVYPSGRELNLGYGAADSQADLLSRPAALLDDVGTTHLADYSYLGLAAPVVVDYDERSIEYTLIGTAGGDDPDLGDIGRRLD